MTTKHITGAVHNADGGMSPFSGDITIVSAPVIQSVTVTPQSAPSGTARRIMVTAFDPDGLPLTYECSVDGVPMTPTATPGEFIWHG